MNEHVHPLEGIIIFTRYPQPGKVKTRLIPEMGDNGSAMLHKKLTEHVINNVRPLADDGTVQIELHYTGGTKRQMEDWLGRSMPLRKQQGSDLGRKMAAAFRSAWKCGYQRIVLIGSDCPSIDAELVRTALNRLRNKDVVLGQTHDGGYYLVGLNCTIAAKGLDQLFDGIAWGTPEVFRQTIGRIQKAVLTVATLQQLHDIDRPDDLKYFSHYSLPQ